MSYNKTLQSNNTDLQVILDTINALPEATNPVQPDWNQSDEMALDFIKNRTHWADEPVTTVETILEETAFEFDEWGSSVDSLPIQLIDGAELTVTWDGVEYTATAWAGTHPDMGDFIAAGNPLILGMDENAEDNGQPFAMAYIAAYSAVILQSAVEEATSHTVKIVSSVTTQEFHKLDSRYIPEHSHKWNDVKDRPFVTVPSETLVCPDNTEGCTKFIVEGLMFTKVSDDIPTKADCANGIEILYRIQVGKYVYDEEWIPFVANAIQGAFADDGFCLFSYEIFAMFVVPHDNYDWEGTIIPESGIYIANLSPEVRIAAITIPGYEFQREVLDSRYLPDNVGGGSDLEFDSAPTSGSENPVTSDGICKALEAKQDTITLTSDKALVSDADGKVSVSDVTAEELGYLSGAAANLQEQITSNALNAHMALPGSLKWDGVIGDKEIVIMEETEEFIAGYVHISDEYPLALQYGGGGEVISTYTIDSGIVSEPAEIIDLGDGAAYIVGVASGFAIIPSDNFTAEEITFPKKGVYTMVYNLLPCGLDVSVMYGAALYIPLHSFADNNNSGGNADKYFEKVTTTTYVEDTLTWDGNTDGLVAADVPSLDTSVMIYRVSEDVPAVTDFSNGFTISIAGEEVPGTLENVTSGGDGAFILFGSYIFIISRANYSLDGVVFPEPGIYFFFREADGEKYYVESLTVPGYNFTKNSVTQEVIKTEHLPEALRFGEITVSRDTLTWDGNTDGLVSFSMMEGSNARLYQISDIVPSLEDLYQGFTISKTTVNSGDVSSASYSAEDIKNNSYIVTANDNMIDVEIGSIIIYTSDFETDGGTFPAGIYFLHNPDTIYISSLTINGYDGFKTTEFVKIDPKYLPDDIGSGSGLPEVTTDDNGKSVSVVNGEWVVKKTSYNDLDDKPTLFSGSYNDLTDKPTLGTAAYTNSTDYAKADHSQSASKVTAGTFAGQVVANSSGQTYSTSLLRNSKLVSKDTNPTVNGEICWVYE